MIVKVEKDSLKRYESMVKAIAVEYLIALNNSMLFNMKLAKLEFSIVGSPRILTSGLTNRVADNINIMLAVNEKNGDDYVAFIIAHELAHLLFQKITDCLCVTGRATDGSTEFTAITRLSYNGKFYGKGLEEQCADILALYIIKRLGYSVESPVLKADLKKTEAARKIVEDFISVFGAPLSECEKIDDYKVVNGYGFVSNSFWYYVVTFSFVEVVRLYDEVMGRNAFEHFCTQLDNHEKKHNIELLRLEVDKFREIGKVA